MLRRSVRAGLGLAVIAASAATLTSAQPPAPPGAPPGQPGAAAAEKRAILDFAVIENRWHWLLESGGEVQILTGSPNEPSLRLASGRGFTEIALNDESIWLLQREGTRGSLLKLPRTGGTPTVMLANLDAPGGLCVMNHQVCWIESHAPAVPGLLNVPAAEARNVVRMLSEDGSVRDLGTMMGGSPAANDDLIGAMDMLCARLRRLGSTEFYLLDLRQTTLKRVAVEEGPQQGLVYHRGFVWTAPSEEASDPMYQRCLRRSHGEDNPRSLTDWLPANGKLLRLGAELYYADMELHRIPENGGAPIYVDELPAGELVSDGGRVILLDPKSGPRVVYTNKARP